MTKGNDGSAARRRSMRKLLVAAAVAFGITFVIVYYNSDGNSAKIHGYEDDRYIKNYQQQYQHRRQNQEKTDDSYSDQGGSFHGRGDQRFGRYGIEGDESHRMKPRGFDGHNHGDDSSAYAIRRGNGAGADSVGDGDDSGRGFPKFRKFGKFGKWQGHAGRYPGSRGRWGSSPDGNDGTDDVSGSGVGDLEVADGEALAAHYRRELIQRQEDPEKAKESLEGILDGSINLVTIVKTDKLKYSSDASYTGIVGQFCNIDFSPHKKNPPKYPMFRFLVQSNRDCSKENVMYFDLEKVAYLARLRDQEVEENSQEVPKVLNLTAVAFHESRCGSTLVANTMIAMDPEKHRSYSESHAPNYAFNACGNTFNRCSQNQAAAILKDSIYLMSRTDDHREERVFFKFQSTNSRHVSTFQMAFPNVPWMYVYRDPVQVMMSHVNDDPTMRRTICTKSRRTPPMAVYEISTRHGRSSPTDLTAVEYCAAHLAQLTEGAVSSLNDMAIPVGFDQLPGIMWEKIYPRILGRPLKQFEIDNLKAVSKSYSKVGQRKDMEFKGDSEQKEKLATDDIREAAREFMKESFDQLVEFEPKLLE